MININHGKPHEGLIALARLWPIPGKRSWSGMLQSNTEVKIYICPSWAQEGNWTLLQAKQGLQLQQLAELWTEKDRLIGPYGLAWVVFCTEPYNPKPANRGTLYLAQTPHK